MSVITILVGSLSIGAAGAVGYWMLNTSRRMVKLLDLQTLLRESQSTHFHHLNRATEDVISEVQSVQSTMNALAQYPPGHRCLPRLHTPSFWTMNKTLDVPSILRKFATFSACLTQHQTTTSVDTPSSYVSHESMLRRLAWLYSTTTAWT